MAVYQKIWTCKISRVIYSDRRLAVADSVADILVVLFRGEHISRRSEGNSQQDRNGGADGAQDPGVTQRPALDVEQLVIVEEVGLRRRYGKHWLAWQQRPARNQRRGFYSPRCPSQQTRWRHRPIADRK